MNDTDGLLAEAQVEGDDNQQQAEETSIPHQLPDNEPSVDSVTVAKEGEEVELEKPDWYPEKFWNEDDGPDLEILSSPTMNCKKSLVRASTKPLTNTTQQFLKRQALVTMTRFIAFTKIGQKRMVLAKRRLSS